MRFLATCLVYLVWLVPAVARPLIEVTGRPEPGDHFRYLVERSRESVRDGRAVHRDARASAMLDVVDTGERGLMLSWTLEHVELGGEAGLDADNLTSQLLTQVTGFPIVYWTDNSGSMREITNFERLEGKLAQASTVTLSAIEATMRESGAGESQIEGARALASEILSRISDLPADQLGYQLLPEAALTTYAFDMTFFAGETKIYSGAEPSPFGGPPLALAGELTVTAYDEAAGLITIAWKESFAPDAVEGFVREFAAMFEDRLPEDRREEILGELRVKARGITIDRRGELVVDLEDGMTVRGSLRKETTIGDARSVDVMSIRRHP